MSERTCEAFLESIDALFGLAGEMQPSDKWRKHLDECPECARTFELMKRLKGVRLYSEPSDAEFLAMRKGVMREIRRQPVRRSAWKFPSWRPLAALAGAAAVIGLAFFAGRHSRTPSFPQRGWAHAEDPMIIQIKRAALENQGLPDLEKAPFTYENVRVEGEVGGQVALSFDVSRHVALTLPKNDPLVTDVLIQTLVSPAPVGAKLQAISCSGSVLEPKVRSGLVRAMLGDPNLGVRLEAQAKLIEHNGDPEVQEALLRVLQNEESVQMKLVAIDYLTHHQIAPDLLEQALAPAGKRDAAYLKAMNYVNKNGGNL